MSPVGRLRVVGPGGRLIAVVEEARTPWSRMVGLLGRASLARGQGLLLAPAWSIHTWFMRFPIDVAHVDAEMKVLRITTMKPNRLGAVVWRARAVIECEAGLLQHWGVAVGDQLEIR